MSFQYHDISRSSFIVWSIMEIFRDNSHKSYKTCAQQPSVLLPVRNWFLFTVFIGFGLFSHEPCQIWRFSCGHVNLKWTTSTLREWGKWFVVTSSQTKRANWVNKWKLSWKIPHTRIQFVAVINWKSFQLAHRCAGCPFKTLLILQKF